MADLTPKEEHALLIDFHGSVDDPDPQAWDDYDDWKAHQESARAKLRDSLASGTGQP